MGVAGHLRRRGFTLPVEQLDPERFLPFEPKNEHGVVYVFALVAEKLGFDVEHVQAAFPDCIARWGEKRARIEFEFRSRNFELHGHDPGGCDLVVCWRHDWPSMPAGLAPLELRKLFGRAREVFLVAYREEFWERLPEDREPSGGLWSVPSSAGPGDLLLVYRPRTSDGAGGITDVFCIHTPPERVEAPTWRSEADWMAQIQLVASLRKPVPFSRPKELGAHGGIEARPRRTEQWPLLFRELAEQSEPSHSLRRFEVL